MCSIKGAIERASDRTMVCCPCALCMCVQCLLSELVPIHGVNAYEPSGFARTVGTWKPNHLILHPCPHQLALKLCLRKASCFEVLHCDFGFRFPLLRSWRPRLHRASWLCLLSGRWFRAGRTFQRGLVARDYGGSKYGCSVSSLGYYVLMGSVLSL